MAVDLEVVDVDVGKGCLTLADVLSAAARRKDRARPLVWSR